MVKRKLIVILSALLLMAVTVTACSGNNSSEVQPTDGASSSSNEPAKATDSPKPKPVELTVLHDQGDYSWPTYQKIADGYNGESGNTAQLKYIPAKEIENWVQTNFIGGAEPEIISGVSPDTLATEFKNGWIIDLLPYMDQIDPYTGEKWSESFLPGLIDSAIDKTDASNPHLFGIPAQVVTVNLYYNKDIFSKVGITEPPATITEFLADCKIIKDAGFLPFSIQNSMDWNLGWFASDLWSYIWKSHVSEFDLNKDQKLEDNEWAIAVAQGKVTEDSPEFKVYLQLLKDLVPYLNEGFNSASWEYEGLFNDGKSAMELNGSWYPNQHQQGSFKVNYGVAPIPYLDKTYSPDFGGTNRLKYMAGAKPSFAVTRNAEKKEAADASVKFLQYLTSPTGGAKVLAQELDLIPVVKGVAVPDLLKPIMDTFGADMQLGFKANALTPEQSADWFKNQQLFLAGKLTEKEFLDNYGKKLKSYAEQAIKNHPEWKADSYLN